ncbi:MAG: MBL fold metallo-hydrolase [Saprospiraceae bacterium]|nr:MBL fold metallo-hydrolase [Saprospiraceae bacterium]
MNSNQFGGKITDQWKSIYESSSNWKGGVFQNLVETKTAINWRQLPGILCKQIRGHKQGSPPGLLPVEAFDKELFLQPSDHAKFIWYGHSVVLMRLQGHTLLIDPMLGGDASPIAPTKTKRFSDNTLQIAEALPEIDLMLLTHDHYDHLDYASIQRLKSKTKRYFVALGVKRHLIRWGVEADRITEFDWWQTEDFKDIQITFTPTRHFSGRGLSSIAKCLWGGWVFNSQSEKIWFSGDGGYGNHFSEIGGKLGPFDFAFMECGQYCDDWAEIHLFPKESVQAALDAGVKAAMPVHWAGFKLSYQHAWYEPVEEFIQYAQQLELSYTTPKLGQVFSVNDASTHHWWQAHK